MKKIFGLVIGFAFSSAVLAQTFTTEQSTPTLKFFDGQVTADLTWPTTPSLAKGGQLKIDLKNASGQAYDLDANDLNVGLFMTSMPDMGTEKQNVVAVADAGGNPVVGSFMISSMSFSMRGGWTLQITLTKPDGSGQTETQNYQFSIK